MARWEYQIKDCRWPGKKIEDCRWSKKDEIKDCRLSDMDAKLRIDGRSLMAVNDTKSRIENGRIGMKSRIVIVVIDWGYKIENCKWSDNDTKSRIAGWDYEWNCAELKVFFSRGDLKKKDDRIFSGRKIWNNDRQANALGQLALPKQRRRAKLYFFYPHPIPWSVYSGIRVILRDPSLK